MLGDKNSYHKMSDESKKISAGKISQKMLSNIASGKFTPCVTNSWARSMTPVTIQRNNKTITINLRSSWEAFFQIKNPNLFFEKLRIPYKINDVVKSYILDFVDEKNNIIYEIKPYALHDTKVNMLKFNAAKKWANENNFKFVIIDNSWFYKNYDPSILIGQPSEERIKKLLKQFFKK